MDSRSDDDWYSTDFLPSSEEDSDDNKPSSSKSANHAHLHAPAPEPASIRRQIAAPSTTFHVPLSTSKTPIAPNSTGTDVEFQALPTNPDALVNPRELGFIPLTRREGEHTFGGAIAEFFRRKSRSTARFLHKLYNVLKISEAHPALYPFVGVRWVTDTVIMVDKVKFARLLAIKAIDGSLFHRQGNFPTHGFVELGVKEARAVLPVEMLGDVDFDLVRLVRHTPGLFVRGCGPEVDETCNRGDV
jgi:hypothetical protein